MSDPLYCSRFYNLKRDALTAKAALKRFGGRYVSVRGKRGCWRVRGKIAITDFGKFVSWEAKREMRNTM